VRGPGAVQFTLAIFMIPPFPGEEN